MDYLVTVNPVFIDKLADYGIPREKVTYIPNVVSEKNFYPLSTEKRGAIRKKCKIEKDTFTVLCVGQLQKRKGVLEFIEIARKMPDCQFVWAGGFSFGKISEGYEEIREAMKHAPKNIKFLGIVDREKMNEVYNMAAVSYTHLDVYKRQIQKNVDEIITVKDEELVVAFLDMVENHKMIVENSGLLTVAALKHLKFQNKKVVSILSGGNMDVITMASVVQNGLIARDRIFTVSVLLPDKPGELVRVAAVIAKHQGNVIKLEHNQFVSTNRTAAVELKITLEAFGTEHKQEIMKALEEEGYRPKLKMASL